MFNNSHERIIVINFILLISIIFFLYFKLSLNVLLYLIKYKRCMAFSKFATFIFYLGNFGILCIVYGFFVEPYWLEVKYITLQSPKIEHSLRIVQISDIHSDPQVRLENKVPKVIEKLKPDLIVFTGDSANSLASLSNFRNLMRKLADIAPIYAIRGNWDISTSRIPDRFKGLKLCELNDSAILVTVRNDHVWLCGKPTSSKRKLKDIIKNIPSNDYKIFLYHYPDAIYEARANNIDLYLAGHTHGGQVALPFYGALITASKYGKKFESGLYKVDNTYLYINKGLGMEGESAPRVRFFARPEITVIDIKRKF